MYDGLETVNATTDLTELLVYANNITSNTFMPLVLFAFFCISVIASSFITAKFTGRLKFAESFAAGSFVTFGLAVLMSSRNGLLNPVYLGISLVVAIVGLMWIIFSRD